MPGTINSFTFKKSTVSLKLHPDKNQGDKVAGDFFGRFKEAEKNNDIESMKKIISDFDRYLKLKQDAKNLSEKKKLNWKYEE